jgi:UDP-N-acetylmuramoylalanine--D-glutamate ligase
MTATSSKTYLILGLARSGQSAMVYLKKQGHKVLCVDDNLEKSRQFQGLEDLNAIPFHRLTALVQSPGVAFSFPAPHPVTREAKRLGVPIMTDINLFQDAHPHVQYMGVTGTNGKSTTTTLLGHILGATVAGNIGIPALDLVPKKTCVLELSSYQLERSQPIQLDVAVWTNISEDHLDRHGTMQAYVMAKERIFEKSKTLVIGIDDPFSKNVYKKIKNHRPTLSVSVVKKADVWVQNGVLFDGSTAVLDLSPIQTLQGIHNHQNAALAYAAAKQMGFSIEKIVEKIKSFKGLVHRQEWVCQKNNITFINDSKATNADAAYWALRAFSGKTILWIAGGIEKSQGIEPLRPFFPHIHHTFLIGQSQENFAKTLQAYPHTVCATLEKAVQNAHIMAELLKKEVTILFSPACASFDQFQDFEHRGDVFKQIVAGLT